MSRAEPGKSASIGEESNASRSGSQPHRTALQMRHARPSLPPAHGLFFLLRGAPMVFTSRARLSPLGCDFYRRHVASIDSAIEP